ncbi:hypothetical protein IWZ03DRAFT_357909 [Phyllosticta citriasiana]|uniref:Uncharacterized protein n=1 Tax=Phyllosticta citriasiana TaxID=595635 RepID=A0ABR1L0P0_9PEZI
MAALEWSIFKGPARRSGLLRAVMPVLALAVGVDVTIRMTLLCKGQEWSPPSSLLEEYRIQERRRDTGRRLEADISGGNRIFQDSYLTSLLMVPNVGNGNEVHGREAEVRGGTPYAFVHVIPGSLHLLACPEKQRNARLKKFVCFWKRTRDHVSIRRTRPCLKTGPAAGALDDQWRPDYWTATSSQATAPVAAFLALKIRRYKFIETSCSLKLSLSALNPLFQEARSRILFLNSVARRHAGTPRAVHPSFKHHGVQKS